MGNMAMSKNVNIVYYVDTNDNTKGSICAIPSDKDMRDKDIISKIANEIEESGILNDRMKRVNIRSVAFAIAHGYSCEAFEYEFGVEEIPLIEC